MKRPFSAIGVVHLPPLLGAPESTAQNPLFVLEAAGRRAIEEARMLERLGYSGVVIENFGDAPFFKDRVPPETIAAMTLIVGAVREAVSFPVGVNVLRNDARAALAIAVATGADFIRVNILSGVTATDQGVIEGEAATLLRERARLGSSVAILADVHVKHGRSLSSDSLSLAIEETGLRAGADGVILSGATTGRPVSDEDLETAQGAALALDIPLYIGSGVDAASLTRYLGKVDGVFIGTALKRNGQAGETLDRVRARNFMKVCKTLQKPPKKRQTQKRKKKKKTSTRKTKQ